jgi:hypothetical protein
MYSHEDKSLKRPAQGGDRSERMPRRRARILGPIAAIAAVIYFLIDALFLSFIRPIAQALAGSGMFSTLGAWVASLGPYPTLALFLIPLAAFEPAKPVGAYLMATGHMTYGVIVIVTGEVFKITIVERLFHFSRDKLMSIVAFAWAYGWITYWLGCLQAHPIWRATLIKATAIKTAARRLLRWSRRLRKVPRD